MHIDQVGRIPYLLAAGIEGPILCSEPSAKLLPIVLEDAFKLSVSRDQAQVERYIERIEKRLVPLPYEHWFALFDHDELMARVTFSGDLGAPHAPSLVLPRPPERADILVLEAPTATAYTKTASTAASASKPSLIRRYGTGYRTDPGRRHKPYARDALRSRRGHSQQTELHRLCRS